MKIEKLKADNLAIDDGDAGPISLTEDQLRSASAGIAPFSCAWTDGQTIHYHDGYPRSV